MFQTLCTFPIVLPDMNEEARSDTQVDRDWSVKGLKRGQDGPRHFGSFLNHEVLISQQ